MPAATKRDLTEMGLADLYKPSAKQFSLVEVPPLNFIMIDGEGDPRSTAFEEALQALYSVSYTLKFTSKGDLGIDSNIKPLPVEVSRMRRFYRKK